MYKLYEDPTKTYGCLPTPIPQRSSLRPLPIVPPLSPLQPSPGRTAQRRHSVRPDVRFSPPPVTRQTRSFTAPGFTKGTPELLLCNLSRVVLRRPQCPFVPPAGVDDRYPTSGHPVEFCSSTDHRRPHLHDRSHSCPA